MEKDNVRQALLYENLSASRVKCHVCQWQCVILPDKLGVCAMRQNRDGVLYTLNYAQTSAVGADPIEKKPLFHFFPGSRVFSLGGWGCNFHCQHCQNWRISCVTSSVLVQDNDTIPPEAAIKLALDRHCQGIAWTYNEPSMWFEYTLDCAKLAKEQGLYTVYVTNGYLSTEALDTIGPFLDAWRVDIKGFSDSFYRQLAKVPRWRGILDVTQRAKEKWDMHIEVVTNIIPNLNDDDEQLQQMASWIHQNLGELTPWHITLSHPQYKMAHMTSTPMATLERAHAIGKKSKLRFVYLGNVPGHINENTFCYSCGKTLIQRHTYETKVLGLDGPKCRFCGVDINMRV